MANPSNPRLMNRVLDAVVHLGDGKGSTARDILDFLRHSSKSTQRNLTMQVHRALKHAVNAGLLRQRSGRYKALFTLNPALVKQPVNETNDKKSVEGPAAFDAEQPPRKVSSSDRRDKNTTRGRKKKQRRERNRKGGRSRQRRRRNRSKSSDTDSPAEDAATPRKYRHKDNEQRDRSPRRRISDGNANADIGNAAPRSSRKRAKAAPRGEECRSDLSDTDYEDRKPKVKRASLHKYKQTEAAKSRGRSRSRNRSPQRQQSQQPQQKRSREDAKRGKSDTDGRRSVDRNDLPEQEMENHHEPDNSASGSTL
ncbi:uncharacterized protein LOC116434681 [Nomia melanderi]|uniref:uncharacterized protein LOC116434681 n=1 Tax=Nomia melanderi TaxID=2448451 RepID=UPI0013040034|nr:splicing regulatory glutamine/lysine-rich protein 1-like [Nomia melanderi]